MKKFRSPPDWTPTQRHAAYVDKSGGADACWPWTGSLSKLGYGQFGINGGSVQAHRAAYEFAFGPFPQHLKILHRCDNRACQNPHHLRHGTQADNIADMVSKNRHRWSKLTIKQMETIYADKRPKTQIAADYGISYGAVRRIKLCKTRFACDGTFNVGAENGVQFQADARETA
jgi:hypothetical protein